MSRFDYHQPGNLAGVIDLLHRHPSEAVVLAGGTALLVDIRHGETAPGRLVSLWGVPGLGEIHANGDIRFGALATITQVARWCAGRPEMEGVREAALNLGAVQVQNAATLGGNICKASPGADMVPPLLCLDATLLLVGTDGVRIVPLDGFLTGPDQTALRPAEVLAAVRLPPPPVRTGTAFQKVMRRRAVDCSIVAVAVRLTLEEDRQTCRQVRIGLGSVASNPFRARQSEALLAGKKLEPDLVRQASVLARQESRPISDVRASADYRRMLVETLVERMVWKAARRAQSGGQQ